MIILIFRKFEENNADLKFRVVLKMRKRNKLIIVSVGALATLWSLHVDRNGMDMILTPDQLDGSYADEDQYLTIHSPNQSQTRSSKGKYSNCKLL